MSDQDTNQHTAPAKPGNSASNGFGRWLGKVLLGLLGTGLALIFAGVRWRCPW